MEATRTTAYIPTLLRGALYDFLALLSDHTPHKTVMEAPIILPYFANGLPHPLPTKHDIHHAPAIYDGFSIKVAIVGSVYAVKYGPRVTSIEAENMIYIKTHTQVPVPKVFAVYIDDDQGYACTFIVMEYIQGANLVSAWPLLKDHEKMAVAEKLRQYMSEIRRLPMPGYLGALGRRLFVEVAFWEDSSRETCSGPFETEEHLNLALLDAFPHLGMSQHRVAFYGRVFPRIFRGHSSVFTHGDFQRKNVMFSNTDGIQVTLIDWEKSGWYPSYWEYSMAMISVTFRDDWWECLESVMDPFYVECPYLRMIYLDLWS